ncbi:hypothetical protein GGTG_13849 [Gaeumannomyces tritici R3-111a-1]|uniref:Uncharacterized protein n=1 Tax=Gaeumannomyces tritici (strain R3-111a-1) TaxID=644352 RepID=J3PK04_GAET3|nr:hypothetical protein GGTG_13849 [Gaeumannomyces tritici R3-111a-1]EJT68574.1 hypothetical protein GGTG_13849 [Gaeumannomyces tritici R3-111a-1]
MWVIWKSFVCVVRGSAKRSNCVIEGWCMDGSSLQQIDTQMLPCQINASRRAPSGWGRGRDSGQRVQNVCMPSRSTRKYQEPTYMMASAPGTMLGVPRDAFPVPPPRYTMLAHIGARATHTQRGIERATHGERGQHGHPEAAGSSLGEREGALLPTASPTHDKTAPATCRQRRAVRVRLKGAIPTARLPPPQWAELRTGMHEDLARAEESNGRPKNGRPRNGRPKNGRPVPQSGVRGEGEHATT